ncbi:MAG: hypothetical protein AMJ67_05885 [Betaproteobacteria bacterium SG8_41]|nr:MAG: hypothetical protein AMJ67_05885 [Betaproteobacteria bacterium SG8_41]
MPRGWAGAHSRSSTAEDLIYQRAADPAARVCFRGPRDRSARVNLGAGHVWATQKVVIADAGILPFAGADAARAA